MKLLIVLALIVAVAFALPVEEVGENQEVDGAPLNVADLETEGAVYDNSDVLRLKRHHGKFWKCWGV